MSQLQCVSPPREIRIPIDRLTFCISELGALIFRRRRIFLRKFVKEIINFGFKIAFVESKTKKKSPAARNKIFSYNSHNLRNKIFSKFFVRRAIKCRIILHVLSRVWPRGPGNIIIIIKFVLHNDESTLSCL